MILLYIMVIEMPATLPEALDLGIQIGLLLLIFVFILVGTTGLIAPWNRQATRRIYCRNRGNGKYGFVAASPVCHHDHG
jgi:hypothetical protein